MRASILSIALGGVLAAAPPSALAHAAQEAPPPPPRPRRESPPFSSRLLEPEAGGAGLRKYTVLDTRRVRMLFEEAAVRLRAGAVKEGLGKLQEILSEHANELLRDQDQLGRYRGAGALATEWLWALDEGAASIYESLHEPPARALLREAQNPPSRVDLARLAATYPRTPSALEALRVILDLDLEHGEPVAAMASADRLLARPDLTPAARAEVLLQALRAAGEAGDAVRFEAYRAQAHALRLAPAARPRWRGEPVDPETFAASLAAKVPRGRATGTPGAPRKLLDSLANPRWSLTIPNPLLEAKNFLQTAPSLPFEPVVADRVVYVANGFSLRALDLYSGEILWTSDSPMEKELARARVSERNGLLEPQSPHLVFSAAVGPRVVVTNLQVPHHVKKDSWRNFDIWQTLPERRLFAFDRQTGKLVWSHWRPLAGALEQETVTAPPVLGAGLVFAEAHRIEGKVSSYAVAFDAQTGERVWKTYLLTGQEDLNMFGRLFMEHPASPPTLDGGVLYLCTNLGLVAAVDAATGRILWMAEYEVIPIRSNTHPSALPRIFYWANNHARVSDGVLVVTPLDSKYLYAFEASTGKRLWDLRYDEIGDEPLRYLLDARDGMALVSGTQIYAFDLRTGALRWSGHPREPRAYVLGANGGRGTVHEGIVYWPTREGLEVLDLAAEGKKLVPTIPWPDASGDRVAGHVTIAGGAILLAGEDASRRGLLQVAFDPNALDETPHGEKAGDAAASAAETALDGARVKLLAGDWDGAAASFLQALEAAASMPAVRAREIEQQASQGLQRARLGQGDAHLAEGRLDDARDAYRAAWREGGFAGGSVRALLQIAAISRQLGEPAEAIEALETLADDYGSLRLAELGDDRTDGSVGLHALLRLADLHERAHRPAATIDVYQRILREYPHETTHGQTAAAWAQRVIDTILEEEGREHYARWDREAAARLEAAREEEDAAGIEEILRLYPNSRHAGDAALALAALHARGGEDARAVQTLVTFLQQDRRASWTPAILAALADRARAMGNEAWERRLRERLTRERSVAESPSRPAPPATRRPPPPDALRLGPGPLHLRWRTRLRRHYPLQFLEPQGAPPPQAEGLALVLEKNGLLYAFGPDDPQAIWSRIEATYQLSFGGMYHGGNLVIGTGNGITAIQPASGVDVWPFKPPGSIRDLDLEDGLLFVTTQAGAGGESVALHVATADGGKALWTLADTIPENVDDLEPQEGRLVVRARSPMRYLVLDPLTGRVLHEIPFQPATGGYGGEAEGDRILVPDERVAVKAWDLLSGEQLWARRVKDPARDHVDRAGTRLLHRWVAWTVETAGTSPEDRRRDLEILDRTTGASRLSRRLAEGEDLYVAPRLLDAPDVFTVRAGARGLTLTSLEPATGITRWSTALVADDDIDARLRGLLPAGRELVALAESRAPDGRRIARLFRLERPTGRIVATEVIADDPADSDCDLTGSGGKVYVLKGSYLRCYDADS